jgi:hypothetical protein
MHFSEELVYSKSISAHGNYKYLRVVPIGSGGQNPILSLTSTTQTQFELPNNVLNLSKSKLCFDVNIVANGGGICNNIHGNALSLIDRITLTSRSGTILADIPNCHIFGNMVSAVNTKLSDLVSRTPINTVTMTMGGHVNAATALGLSQLTPVSDIVRCNGTANYQVGGAGLEAFTPNTEPVVFYTAAAAVANSLTYQIELSAFKDTLMELNKNIYFGDNLVLTINWNSANKFSFTTTTTATVTGAAAATLIPQLSNLYIYTACETDPTIISQLVSSVTNGEFSLIIPFVNSQKYASSASAGASMQQRINSTYGSTLLRTYFSIFVNGETDLNAYTHTDANIISYNTMMDGLRLQDYTLSVADGTIWLTNEQNLKNSAIQSIEQYKNNFVHIDNWCGASPCNNDDSLLNGLSLDSDRTWSIQTVTLNAAYKYYLFYTTQKKLVISKGSLTLI